MKDSKRTVRRMVKRNGIKDDKERIGRRVGEKMPQGAI